MLVERAHGLASTHTCGELVALHAIVDAQCWWSEPTALLPHIHVAEPVALHTTQPQHTIWAKLWRCFHAQMLRAYGPAKMLFNHADLSINTN